ncbi:MAG: hypothetical protein U0547_07080 [Dehalococcoidia bacterium]
MGNPGASCATAAWITGSVFTGVGGAGAAEPPLPLEPPLVAGVSAAPPVVFAYTGFQMTETSYSNPFAEKRAGPR